jgi:hypothetical protein
MVREVGSMQRRDRASLGVVLLALAWGASTLLAACASETAAYHQRRAEDHVYIGPRRSFLERAARLLSERGQSPQLVAASALQTRWVLVSGASSDPRAGTQPLEFQSYRVTITSLDDLHHRIAFERGTVTSFGAPSRIEMQGPVVQNDSGQPGLQAGLPSIDPPVANGVPVWAREGDLEWEFLRRTDPDGAASIEQEKPGH